MNTITRQLTRTTMIVAALCAGFAVQGVHAADNKEVRVVQLQPVVIVGKRIRVFELEPVVIVAKRLTPATTVVAQRAARPARG